MDEHTLIDIQKRIQNVLHESDERFVPVERDLLGRISEELVPSVTKLHGEVGKKSARIRAMAEKTTHLLAEFVKAQDQVDGYKRALSEFEQRIRDKHVLNEADLDAILRRIRESES